MPGPLARWLARQARRLRALAQPPDASNFRAAVHRTEAEWRRLLSPLAYAVMRQKKTEAPFSGEYDALYPDEGFFKCAGCSRPLYSARAKFNSGCGWPAFDKCYAGAVFMRRDPDGSRAEILCTGCHSHLGHVFTGEGMTPTDERHCVNSVSIVYDASAPSESVREVMLT